MWRPSGQRQMPRRRTASALPTGSASFCQVIAPLRTGNDAGNGEEGGAFAGAVGAEERDDFAGADLERDVLEHIDRAVAGMNAVEFQHGFFKQKKMKE